MAKRRQRRRNQRQKEKTKRQQVRQQKQVKRQQNRTRRQAARQQSRSQRQQIRQENRTRRAEGRQAVRIERVQQKGASGFYTPEGVAARRAGTAQVIGASGQIVGQVAPLVAGALTGGASLGAEGALGALGGLANNMGGFAGETGLQGFGGAVGLGGDPMPINADIEPMSQGFDFSFKNPIVIAGVALGGLALFQLTRPKRKKK